jgi:rhamnulokinase
MPISKYLAIDLGAESGRVIVGILENDRMTLEEVHRFPNRQLRTDNHVLWDAPYLFGEIKKGLSLATANGHSDVESIGIDTWGVDFALVGEDGALLANPYCYRDPRTNGMMEEVFRIIPRKEIYASTGIQFLQFNSLYQLYAALIHEKEMLAQCASLLFMPDLMNYFLTGKKVSEYTIASTSQLLHAREKTWDENIFRILGLPKQIMAPLIQPGSIVGKLLPEIANTTGFTKEIDVVAVGSHDTASAVAAVPGRAENWAFISSGTWSIAGIEMDRPLITKDTLENDFTNEGGVGGKIRFLRNVTGMWLLQQCRKSWKKHGHSYSYDELIQLASTAGEFKYAIDPDDISFLDPPDMPEAIAAYCRRTSHSAPENTGEFVRCILESLAMKYKSMIGKIISITGRTVETVHIVGGGSRNALLNQFTASATGIPVDAGPVEATALGNILLQAIAKKRLASVSDGRELVRRSFPITRYEPGDILKWNECVARIKAQ